MINGISRFLMILMLVLGLNSAFATNYYIDAASGNDGNNGTSSSSAWKTIGKVNSFTFQPGDSVLFKSGQRFTDNGLVIKYSGNASNYIVYGKYGGATKPIISKSSSSGAVMSGTKSLSYLVFQDIEFRGNISFTMYGYTTYPEGMHHMKFLRLKLDGNASGDATGSKGFYFYSDARELSPEVWEFNPFYDIEFGYCLFQNINSSNNDATILIFGLAKNYWVHHNEFYNCREFLDVTGGDNITIEYNKMVGSKVNGIKIQSQTHSVDNLIIRGNLIAGSESIGMMIFNVKNSHIYNNTVRQAPSAISATAVFGWEAASQPYFCGAGTNNGFFNNRIENNIFIGEWVNFKRAQGVTIKYKNGTQVTYTMNDLWVDNYFHNNIIYKYSDESNYNSGYRIAVSTMIGSVTYNASLGYYAASENGTTTWINETNLGTWNSYGNVSGDIFSDPKFLNRNYSSPNNFGDYKLMETSPARGTGANISSYLFDLLGNIVPTGINPDRGAFQSSTNSIDNIAPSLVSTNITSQTSITLLFSESISEAESENISNYSISGGIAVISATLSSDAKTVTLVTSDHSYNQNYTVTANNIKDLTGNIISSSYNTGTYILINNNSSISVNIKIWLEGPYTSGIMQTSLRENNSIPLKNPYCAAPWYLSILDSASSLPSDIVDWVLVELRTDITSSSSVGMRAALLKSNGKIVDLDGSNPVTFNAVSNGNYYILIHHRNHLAVMSATKQILSDNSTLYDFTTSLSNAYGTDAMANLGDGNFGLYAGDGDANGLVNVLDYSSVGNIIFNSGYLNGDLDLNNSVNVLDYSKASNSLFKQTQIPF